MIGISFPRPRVRGRIIPKGLTALRVVPEKVCVHTAVSIPLQPVERHALSTKKPFENSEQPVPPSPFGSYVRRYSMRNRWIAPAAEARELCHLFLSFALARYCFFAGSSHGNSIRLAALPENRSIGRSVDRSIDRYGINGGRKSAESRGYWRVTRVTRVPLPEARFPRDIILFNPE